jgi:ATP-dependent helicase/nuclease subunit A
MVEQSQAIKLIGETTSRQMRAATPGISAWVSANAGSGKTHVLSQRVVRLLLNGTPPSAILCLTYTKAAAAEMSLRIFDILAKWSQMTDEALYDELSKTEDLPTNSKRIAFARTLFASALETPGGLKIQTIHAFCESLLHRFPLEANVAGHFQVLDDAAAEELQEEARSRLLNMVANESKKPVSIAVADALDCVLEQGGETSLDDLINKFISMRHAISDFISYSAAKHDLRSEIAERLDINSNDQDPYGNFWPLPSMPDEQIEAYYSAALDGKNKSPKDLAGCLMDCKKAASNQRKFEIICEGFLTQAGKPKSLKNAVSKDIATMLPDMAERLEALNDHLSAQIDYLKRRKCLDITEQALVLAEQYIQTYEGLKRRKAMLDYEDLIVKTEQLLSKSGAGPWVHYKLDRGIDHILVDEAQDTSPVQWSVIQSLADEFYTGQSARELNRSMFAVGDEKQSIYSFQGARPERFDQERRQTQKRAKNADKAFDSISLRVSFRSTSEVLDLVDLVFADFDAKRGLTYSDDNVLHETVRQNAPGQVELWPMLAKEPSQEMDSWLEPFDAVAERDPVNILSQQITSVLDSWIGKEEILDHKSKAFRKIRAGDILILVRKRDAFVPTLMRTLKSTTDIAVAGADRLKLTDHIAIQDLMALGRVSLLLEDDLSLASLLKSAFFNVTEEQLFDLCAGRGKEISVWSQLQNQIDVSSFWADIHSRILELQLLSRKTSVHGFYSHILEVLGMRDVFLLRLGHEVIDVLDEYLALALDHDQNGISSLQIFLNQLESTEPEIKREQEQSLDAVRIMTVHASKGLEAPIVFLVDPGSAAFHSSHMSSIRLLDPPEHQADSPKCPLWVPGSAIENSKTDEIKQTAEFMAEEEYRRLLYVGLTRAADRLVVCGYRGTREPSKPTWHMLVEDGFNRAEPEMKQEIVYDFGGLSWSIQRFTRERPLDTNASTEPVEAKDDEPKTRPDILNQPIEKVKDLPRPLVPSGASVLINGDESANHIASPFAKSTSGNIDAIEYGKSVHRLLQVLPNLPSDTWHENADNYLKNRLPNSSSDARNEMIKSVINVMTDTKFSPIFSSDSAAEFSIMGSLMIKDEERIVSGRIDRLVVQDDRLLIVDYKTNYIAPSEISDISPSYIAQLAIYRAVLQPLYPNKKIEAGLLYTRTPKIIEVPANMLDAAMQELSSK